MVHDSGLLLTMANSALATERGLARPVGEHGMEKTRLVFLARHLSHSLPCLWPVDCRVEIDFPVEQY